MTDTSLFDLLSIDCQFFAVLGPDEVSSCKLAQNKAKLYLLCLIMSGGLALLRYINKDLIHEKSKKEPAQDYFQKKQEYYTSVQKATLKSESSVPSNEEKMQVGCPICVMQLHLSASYTGKIRCPHCSTRFDVASSAGPGEIEQVE